MRVVAYITEVETGETRKYEDLEELESTRSDAEEGFRFHWTDGNYGCDCNRAMFFSGDHEADVPCGDERFSVNLLDETGAVFHCEFEE